MDTKTDWLNRLREAFAAATLVKATLSQYRGKDSSFRRVVLRPVRLREGNRLQFVWQYRTRDVTKNLELTEALGRLDRWLGEEFGEAYLFTTDAVVQWRVDADSLRIEPPRHSGPVDRSHDRRKTRLIDLQTPWWQALRPDPDKARQVHKFVEIFASLIGEPSAVARVVDMGCGKGYLTFAVYDWLRTQGATKAQVIGVERREDLVQAANALAEQHGLSGLRFETGNIASYPIPEGLDVLMALHACDTATDDALAKGVRAGARALIVAPCCHKELAPQLQAPAPLEPVTRHGILHHRQAELVTDGLRAALLEWAGYEARVFEFVDMEHTAKNLMITAVWRGRSGPAEPVRELARAFGVKRQRLAEALGFELGTA
ncbi:MAG: SAM-dependent methyltransferase [Verrucomicrobiae bacterium]|nr:SAM-dependent methyltransferase [Verrucomicrobiae bacterium]